MFSVDVEYADLEFSIRKGLASRYALLTLREVALAADDPHADEISRNVLAALVKLKVPIASPDADRLDTFVTKQVHDVLPARSRIRSTPGVCCTECTGTSSVACNGVDDAQHVRHKGHCVLPIKACCELAVRTMHRLYASLVGDGVPRALVNFKVATVCPERAAYCVSGSSSYADSGTDQVTNVTIGVGLEHWDLESYAAVAVILAHELVCHAGHGVKARRKTTGAQDRFIEGWMDFVARNALLAEVVRTRNQNPASPETVLSEAQAQRVAGVIAAWRSADTWRGSGTGPCNEKRYDSAAPHRRFGEKLASDAKAMFDRLGASEAFFEFSAAFNATATNKAERDDWLEDVDVVGCMIGDRNAHRASRALKRFAETRSIEEFRQVWRNQGGP